MASKRHERDRACRCDQADASCVALAVRRLSQERVHELAEEIWTASTGTVVQAGPVPDPCDSRPGAAAQAAYRRCRQREREDRRHGRLWRAGAVVAAALGAGIPIGLTMGAWIGWRMAVLAALLVWWRLRLRPSARARLWRRQAAVQRRTAVVLGRLEREGCLVLHDIVLPGWPASLDHLVLGATGVWAIESWQRSRLPRRRKITSPWRSDGAAGAVRELRWKAAAITDALAGAGIPVRPLLCVHGGMRLRGDRVVEGIRLTALGQLPAVVRQGSRVRPSEVERATARALELLRPAA
jgi:Nuclease-related domain